jgi:TetR/AcrR family transcriptional regulator
LKGNKTVERPKKHIDVSDQIKAHLLKNAANIFNIKGYEGTTVREIVDAAGVSKPVLYYYFGNKEGIFLELFRVPFEQLKVLINNSEVGHGKVSEKLLHLIDQIFVLFCENIVVARLMHSMWYGPAKGAPFFDFDTYHISIIHALQKMVKKGVEHGEWCADNIDDVVWAILGSLSVAVEVQLSHPEKAIGREGLSRILRLIFKGMSVIPE